MSGELRISNENNRFRLTNEAICLIKSIIDIPYNVDINGRLAIIRNAEINILTANIPERDKEYPLIAAAIAKSSTIYWENERQNPSSPWLVFAPSPVEDVVTALADIDGGIDGAEDAYRESRDAGGNVFVSVLRGVRGAIKGAVASSTSARTILRLFS